MSSPGSEVPSSQSMPTTSWPRRRSAVRTPAPDSSDTSRSLERPPISTPIRPRSIMWIRSVVTDDLPFQLERDPVDLGHAGAGDADQLEHVGGAGAAQVDE